MVQESKPQLDSVKRELLLHMKNHIVATMNARKEIYGALKELFNTNSADFYNVSSTVKHIRIIQLMMECLEKYKPHQHLQDAFSVWNSRLAPAVLALSDRAEQRKYSRHAKLLAACLFDSDEALIQLQPNLLIIRKDSFQYTKAIICLGHVVRLHDDDIHSRILLTYWLCLLGYWSLAKTQVLQKEVVKQMNSVHKEIINEVINNIIHLHTEKITNHHSGDALPMQDHILKAMQCFESILTKSKTKTFQQYEAKILVKRVLIAASHFSSADLALIGDPLQNMDFIKACYETLVKCRSNVYYGNNMKEEDASCAAVGAMFFSAGDEFQETKIDEYLKLSAVLAEHFKVVLQLCFKYIELGILRESESEGLKLLHQVLKTTNLQRCLAVLNVLFLTSTVAHGNSVNIRPNPFRPIIASLWNRSKNGTSVCANDGRQKQNNESNSSSRNQEIIDLTEDKPSNLLPTSKENTENKLVPEEHVEDCDCVICMLCNINPQMRTEAIFSKLLFYRYSSKIFRVLSERILKLPQETSLDVIAIYSALQKEVTEKAIEERRYPLETLDRFLFAAIRWLRRVGGEEKPEIVQDVIKESLKICSTDPIYFRWQWLTIKQLARRPLKIPKLEWMHMHVSPLKAGLRSPLKSIVINLASELNTLTLCSPKPSPVLNSETYTPISKANRKIGTKITPGCVDAEMEEARKDFDSFSHLFYREWRFQICSYLGQVCAFQYKADWIESGWSAAYYFNEAMFISTRQLARMISKKSEGSQDFHFENIEKFKKAVQHLPSDLTVVQLFLDSRRILWLIKLYNDRSPLVVPVAFIPQDNVLLKRFLTLLLENEASGNLSRTCTDPKEYWQIRRKLDKKLKTLVSEVQTEWFGIFSDLLLPSVSMNDAHVSVMNELMSNGLSRSFASTLVENLDLSTANWRLLVQRFSTLENFDETVATYIGDCRNRWISKFGKQSFIRDFSNSYVVFCISPELASFPFELLPVMESHKRVCRISSFHMFEKLLSHSKKIPKTVDGKNSFYVLDPGGDLTDTQKRLSKELEKYSCWKGTIGAAPKPEELRNSLETNDLFFYMGHGSGGKYFGRSTVLRSNIRAVSLLMGCSSVRIIYEGEGFDGRGAIYDYIIAKCPCIVGCLWMVTDGEIDRVLLAVLDFCFSEMEKPNSDKIRPNSSYRLLIDAIAYARTACKLKYMTGGAVVAYGLPIVTHLSQDMIAMKQQSDTMQLVEENTALLSKSREVLETRSSSGKPSRC
uniref:separase n=1 Tax=Onchocerca volvulus TaxID=6282 RepID=A0A8R1U0C8_ONCVO